MPNKRIYFANQQISFRADGDNSATCWIGAHGVQSVAVTTTFNLDQAFELGQLEIYENIEGVPDVEMSMTKVLDGYPLLYHLATKDNTTPLTSPTLAGRSNSKCNVAVGVWQDTQDNASGDPGQQMETSGMFCSALTYNFPLEDSFTEDVTLVGNNKVWVNPDTDAGVNCATPGWEVKIATGIFPTGGDGPTGTGGVNRRENLSFATDVGVLAGAAGIDYTRLPTDIPGVDSSGWMSPTANASNIAHVGNISVSTDLGREELFELGTRQPYARVVTFPIEVTCDIELVSASGDMVDALADGCGGGTSCTGIVDNLSNQVIRIATCEGTRIFLGTKNKLASVNYGGGDAGGGNVAVTYSYTTFNDLTVMHPEDPSTGVEWANRSTYLQ